MWKIDETLTMIHGAYVKDIDGDGRAEILTASREGIYRFDWEGEGRRALVQAASGRGRAAGGRSARRPAGIERGGIRDHG